MVEPSFTIKEPSYERSFEALNVRSKKYFYKIPAVWRDHVFEIFLATFDVSSMEHIHKSVEGSCERSVKTLNEISNHPAMMEYNGKLFKR